ncbi:MAG: hypothetical protein CR981_00210, partial [Proteobacteria bacterium]
SKFIMPQQEAAGWPIPAGKTADFLLFLFSALAVTVAENELFTLYTCCFRFSFPYQTRTAKDTLPLFPCV